MSDLNDHIHKSMTQVFSTLYEQLAQEYGHKDARREEYMIAQDILDRLEEDPDFKPDNEFVRQWVDRHTGAGAERTSLHHDLHDAPSSSAPALPPEQTEDATFEEIVDAPRQ